MATPTKHDLRRVLGAFEQTITAHAAIAAGIATHAEKHVAEVDEMRRKVRENAAIESGIARQNQPDQSTV